MLQKIHATLWDAMKEKFGDKAEVTHAHTTTMVVRPAPGFQTVSIRFQSSVWEVIREADEHALLNYGGNVGRIVGNALARYPNDPASNAFIIEIDDRALDE